MNSKRIYHLRILLALPFLLIADVFLVLTEVITGDEVTWSIKTREGEI